MRSRSDTLHSTLNIEHSTLNICISELLGRKDHVLAEIGTSAPRHPIEIRVRLPDGLFHGHAEVVGDAADDVDGAFDFEIVADRRAVENNLDLVDAPDLAELLIPEDRLVSERVEKLDGALETLHARLHFLARLHAAFARHRSSVRGDRILSEFSHA